MFSLFGWFFGSFCAYSSIIKLNSHELFLPSVSALVNFCSSFLFLLFESPFIFEDLPEIVFKKLVYTVGFLLNDTIHLISL